MAHGILVPGPGNWMSPALAGGFLTTGPGKSLKNSLKHKIGMDGNFHVTHRQEEKGMTEDEMAGWHH